VVKDINPARRTGGRAVITLPERIDGSNAGPIRTELLSVINGGADELIADLTATISCDHAGADALARAHHQAAVSGTELRLVVTTPAVRRTLSRNGLDRMVSIYPSLAAATVARTPATVIPMPASKPAGTAAATTPAVMWTLVDALQDGVALTDSNGLIALANLRLEEMSGYEHGELTGRQVESLVPADLRAAHRGHRAAYAGAPVVRPMGAGARLVAMRKDGTTFPVEISLSPVATATGSFTLTVIRDVTEARRLTDLADLALIAVTAKQAHLGQGLLDSITTRLYNVGLSLQAAADQPHETARQAITTAFRHLDDVLREIREHAFATRDQ